MKNKHLICLICLLVNLLIYGYTFSANTYSAQDLPFINKMLDPELFPGDLYADTFNSFPSLFIHVMAGLAKVMPVTALFFIVYLGIKYLFILTGYQTALLLFGDDLTALLAALLFATAPLANNVELFSGQPLMQAFVYHGVFAVPFGLRCLYLFLKQRHILSLILLGGVFYFNALLAVHLTIMLLFASLIPIKKQTVPKADLIKGWAAFVLIIIPFALKYILGPDKIHYSDEFVLFLKNWHPEHYFHSSWPLHQWIRGISFCAVFLFTIFHSFKSKAHPVIKRFLYAIAAMWLMAGICGELLIFNNIILLQFFRSDIFIIFLGLLYASFYLRKTLFDGRLIPFLAGMLLLVFLTDLHLYSKTILTAIIAIFLIIFILFYRVPTGNKTFSRQTLIVSLIILVTLLPYADIIFYRIRHKTFSYTEPLKSSWHDVQNWAKHNTAKDAKFLTPPYLIGFRVFSNRGTFVERLDGGAGHWSAGIEKEWEKRLGQLGYEKLIPEYNIMNPSDPMTQRSRAIYASVDEPQIIELSRKYGIDYIVEENFRKLALPKVYANTHFSVYKIKRGNPGFSN